MTISKVKNKPHPAPAAHTAHTTKPTEHAKKNTGGDAKKNTGVSANHAVAPRSQTKAHHDTSGLNHEKSPTSTPKHAAAIKQLHKAVAGASGAPGAHPPAAAGVSGSPSTADRGLISPGSSGGSNAISDANSKKVGKGTTTQGGGDIVANKKAALAGIPNATPAEKAFVIAVGMQETNSFSANERDKSKDGTTDGSRNFSAYNMNGAMLKDLGVSPQQMEALNDPKNQGQASQVLLQAYHKYGEDGVLAWHRGGGSAYDGYVKSGYKDMTKGSVSDPKWYQSYYNSVYSAQNAINGNNKLLTDNSRVGTGPA